MAGGELAEDEEEKAEAGEVEKGGKHQCLQRTSENELLS